MFIRSQVTKTNLLVFTPPWSSTVACWGQEFCFCTRPPELCAGAWEAVEDTGMCFPLPLPLPFSSHSEKVTKNFSHLPLKVLCVYVCACMSTTSMSIAELLVSADHSAPAALITGRTQTPQRDLSRRRQRHNVDVCVMRSTSVAFL